VPNLRARLCLAARHGQILVSEPVYLDVEALVEAKPVGAVPLRGFARPVVVFDVLGLRTAPAAPAATGAAP
jgi:class 3 adenylate cyclase